MQVINVKIIVIALTLIVASAGVYHFTQHDTMAEKMAHDQEEMNKATDHVYSDYTKVGVTKPINIPGTNR